MGYPFASAVALPSFIFYKVSVGALVPLVSMKAYDHWMNWVFLCVPRLICFFRVLDFCGYRQVWRVFIPRHERM